MNLEKISTEQFDIHPLCPATYGPVETIIIEKVAAAPKHMKSENTMGLDDLPRRCESHGVGIVLSG